MEYKIGKFAKMLGVSADALRHYERCGLLSPRLDTHNGYRYYTDKDAFQVFSIRMYRGLDMSISEIADRLHNGRMEEEAEWTWDEISRLDDEIMRLQQLRQRCRNRLDAIERARNMVEQVVDIRLPPAYQLYYEDLFDSPGDFAETMMQAWTKGMPFVGQMFLLERKDVESGAALHPKLGLGARLGHIEEFDLPIDPPVRMMSGGAGIRRQFATPDPFAVGREELAPLLAYAGERGYGLNGDVVYMIDAVDHSAEGAVYYIDMHMQVHVPGTR